MSKNIPKAADHPEPLGRLAGARGVACTDSELQALQRYLAARYSAATVRAYRNDWDRFVDYCRRTNRVALPAEPETVAFFLASEAQAGRRASTLQRRIAAIRLAHQAAGEGSPTHADVVAGVMRGIRREHGGRPSQKAPILADQIKVLADRADLDTLAGIRDRALLLLGFAAALRRSELVSLHWSDIEWVPQGMRVHVRRSKTDQEGLGQTVPVPRGGDYCPVAALLAWQGAAGVAEGPVFRGFHRGGRLRSRALSPYSVALIVQRYAAAVGWEVGEYAAHSLRAGWATSAAMNRASLLKMREVTRHKSLQTLQIYIRRAEEFVDHAGEGLL